MAKYSEQVNSGTASSSQTTAVNTLVATLSHLHQQLCLYFAGHLLRLKLNDTGVAIDECKGLQRQEEV